MILASLIKADAITDGKNTLTVYLGNNYPDCSASKSTKCIASTFNEVLVNDNAVGAVYIKHHRLEVYLIKERLTKYQSTTGFKDIYSIESLRGKF